MIALSIAYSILNTLSRLILQTGRLEILHSIIKELKFQQKRYNKCVFSLIAFL